jgi:hypothetical protein
MTSLEASRLTPDDVRAIARWSHDLLEPLGDADWGQAAWGLEWTCRQTVEHMVFAVDRYSMHLATPSPESAPRPAVSQPHLTNREVLALLLRRAGVLAVVAGAAAPTARGSHPWGLADAQGFIGMAIAEIAMHTDDVLRALGRSDLPPSDVCRRALARLFPWAPTDVEPWAALRWATGRADLPGHPHAPANWAGHPAPLTEWDGTVSTMG